MRLRRERRRRRRDGGGHFRRTGGRVLRFGFDFGGVGLGWFWRIGIGQGRVFSSGGRF